MTIPKHPPTTLLECLGQGEVWQDVDGSWHPIATMPVSRALRVLGGLELKAVPLAYVQWVSVLATSEDGADLAEARDVLRDPRAWLRAHPFYRALAERICAELGWAPQVASGVTA